MKISSFDLKELIRTQEEALISEECPSPELIVRCVRQELSGKDRRKILDHISRCGQCAADAKAVLDIVDKENAVIQDINSHLRSKDSNASEKSISSKRFLLSPIPAALIIVVIVALGAYFIIGSIIDFFARVLFPIALPTALFARVVFLALVPFLSAFNL